MADESAPEIIETVISELDQSTFALALVGGAVVGGFLLWLYLKRDEVMKPVQKQVSNEETEEERLNALAERVASKIEIKFPEQEDSEIAVDAPWAAPAFMEPQG